MKRQRSKSSQPKIELEPEEIGRSEEHVAVFEDGELETKIDQALGLQMISIRLEKGTIDAFKLIASRNKGIGYQTLMRQALKRFATAELKHISRQLESELAALPDVPSEKRKAA